MDGLGFSEWVTVPTLLLCLVFNYEWWCEGDTEMRPLVYRDSLRQGEPNRCDTLTQW